MRIRYLIAIGVLVVLLLAALGAFLVFGYGTGASAQTVTSTTTTSRADDDTPWLGLDHVAGTVTNVNSSTIAITRFDGATQTIKVDSQTRYESNDTAVSLSSVKNGSHIYADGTTQSDGSFKATRIVIGSTDQDQVVGLYRPGDSGFHDGQVQGAGPGRVDADGRGHAQIGQNGW